MLVKKVSSEWKPSEKPDLKVGETIEITDPKDLILQGKAVAVTKEGAEISSYELYGVITANERKDFEEYLAIKKQQSLKSALEKEAISLKTQLDATKTVVSTPPVVQEEQLSYQELVKRTQEKGLWRVGLKKTELEALLKT